MRPIWLVRAVAVAAALFAASFISFPSFSGAGLFTVNPPTVDRTSKADRLPLTIGTLAAPRQQSREKVLVGCAGALSPIASPRLANVLRRCTV
jgi:hypothetical protein